MAEPTARYLLPAGVLRRVSGQSPRRRLRTQEGYLHGAPPDGAKEIRGIWIERTDGANFWLRVVKELKPRGAQDILIPVFDGPASHKNSDSPLRLARAALRPEALHRGPNIDRVPLTEKRSFDKQPPNLRQRK